MEEEAQKLAASVNACPFFAARAALPLAEVVAMPYQVLLSPETRDSYGLSMRDSVVIVDEAHNFLESVYAASSFSVRLDALRVCCAALKFWQSATKSTHQQKIWGVMQTINVLERLLEVLDAQKTTLMTTGHFTPSYYSKLVSSK